MASRAAKMTVPCGSPKDLAPEGLGGGNYGRERDVWSTGVVAHELLFDRHPYGEGSDEEILERIRSVEMFQLHEDVAKSVSMEVRSFIEAVLMKDPAERMAAAEAAQHRT